MKKNIYATLVKTLFFLSCTIFIGIFSCQKKSTSTVIVEKDSVSFIVIGDWGMNGAPTQLKVADQMNKIAKLFNAKFIISTGDNIYPSGVSSITDSKWQTSFEGVYNKDSLPLGWYIVLGNHDYLTSPQAEIDYSKTSSRWHLPSRYYSIIKPINGTSSILFVFTDTSPFVSSYYTSPPTMPDLTQQDTAGQISWLSTTLHSSTDTWKIVVGHHPIYSGGIHGNTTELIARYKPVLTQTKVDFYLAGHDHDLESLKLSSDPLYYLVSGGGSENFPIISSTNSLYDGQSPGFLVMSIYPSKAEYYFYNENGGQLYHQEIKR